MLLHSRVIFTTWKLGKLANLGTKLFFFNIQSLYWLILLNELLCIQYIWIPHRLTNIDWAICQAQIITEKVLSCLGSHVTLYTTKENLSYSALSIEWWRSRTLRWLKQPLLLHGPFSWIVGSTYEHYSQYFRDQIRVSVGLTLYLISES